VDDKERLQAAGNLAAAFQETSDLLMGSVATLVREGWSEEHARAIVVATYVSHLVKS
jgi:hypothetical protein